MKVNGKQILVGIGFAVIIFLMADFNNRMSELHRLSTQRDHAQERVAYLIATQTFLETQVAYATSQAAVESWAYEEGKMIRPGDNLVVPVPVGDSQPTPVPEEPPAPEPLNNWEIWLALFFDRMP